jgi:uncharacterized damage-inducible protein DinB
LPEVRGMSADPLREQLLDSWRIHNRINLYLLDAIADEALDDVAPTRGRSVAMQFAHLHNVRLMWLKAAEPALLLGLEKFASDGPRPGREALRAALEGSATEIESLLAAGLESGRIKGFKPHPAGFLGYLIAHESHHRGQVMLTLKANGHLVDKKVQFGLWEWGVR